MTVKKESKSEPIVIDKFTLVPISFLCLIAIGTYHFVSIKNLAEGNNIAIKEAKEDIVKEKDNIAHELNNIKKSLYRIEGRIQLLSKEK